MTNGMILTMLKPLLPRFSKWLNSHELEEGEVSSSILLNVVNNELRIDIVTMKILDNELTVSRILNTISQDELTNSDK